MFDNFFYLSPLLAMLICLRAYFGHRRLVKDYKHYVDNLNKLKANFEELVKLRKIEKAKFEAAMQEHFSLDLDDDLDLDDGGLDLDLDLDFDDEPEYKPKRLPKPKPKRLPLLRG